MGKVSESIFSGKRVTIPMADVQHVEKQFSDYDSANGKTKIGDLTGGMIITKHTRWDMDADTWANNIWLGADELRSFLRCWCDYRAELESETLMDAP